MIPKVLSASVALEYSILRNNVGSATAANTPTIMTTIKISSKVKAPRPLQSIQSLSARRDLAQFQSFGLDVLGFQIVLGQNAAFESQTLGFIDAQDHLAHAAYFRR